MCNTGIITVNQKFDNGGVTPWSELNHDVLNLVMMRLGVIDFLAFSGVCKSWRSIALSYRNIFMSSRLPMSLCISTNFNENHCILEDFDGRKFKTILPHSAGRTCVGLTCGYLILYERKTCDFWLVNPITRHELYFPPASFYVGGSVYLGVIRGVLVSSPSIPRWVFVVINPQGDKIWFSMAGKRVWNHVSSIFRIYDLHASKGKIYTLHNDHHLQGVVHVCEMRLHPKTNLMKLETKNILKSCFRPQFVRAGENLYVIQFTPSGDLYKLHELDFWEMKWVCHDQEKTREEYAFFINVNSPVSISGSRFIPYRFRNLTYAVTDKSRNGSFNYANMWYFPHDCLNVNLID